MKLYEVLRRPILTEKSNGLKDTQKKVVVEVASWANKHQISSAAKLLFGVEVESVNTLVIAGKSVVRNTKRAVLKGRKPAYKKAVVTLAAGEEINIFSEE